jgi:hypothetical protein
MLVNDAEDVHADLRMSAMGFASSDIDVHGTLNYCIAFSITCLQTIGGTYFEGGESLGLRPDYDVFPGW